MPIYKIADLFIDMKPLYPQMNNLLSKYKTEQTEVTNIKISLTEDYYKKRQKENPHLTLEECENIWSSSYFSSEIIKFNGVVLHSSAICYNGGAYLFTADSGVGKSTHTALWQQEFGKENIIIINDDKPAIRLIDNTFNVFGTPWCGNSYTNTNIKVPLKGIVFLERSNVNCINKTDNTGEIFSKLYKQILHFYHKEKMNIFLDTLENLIKTTKFYRLCCNTKPDSAYMAKEFFDLEEKNEN